MNAPPYQKLFWGSYHKHTAHLRHAREHGAYLLLIGALWNNEGKLPADDDVLAGYAMLTTKEWLAIKPKLMPLFRVLRGKLTQPRVTEDLSKYRDTSGKRKVAGKAGGIASAEKQKGNGTAIARPLPTKPEPEPDNRTEDKSSDADGVGSVDPDRATWDLALQVLTDQGNMPDRSARSFFAGLLKEHGLTAKELLPAVGGALSMQTREPRAYLVKAAAGVAKRRSESRNPARQAFV